MKKQLLTSCCGKISLIAVPWFLSNFPGSSAGAGSGDFHVYRGVRRREYARQKFLDEKFEAVCILEAITSC